jgi:hypothetical protein
MARGLRRTHDTVAAAIFIFCVAIAAGGSPVRAFATAPEASLTPVSTCTEAALTSAIKHAGGNPVDYTVACAVPVRDHDQGRCVGDRRYRRQWQLRVLQRWERDPPVPRAGRLADLDRAQYPGRRRERTVRRERQRRRRRRRWRQRTAWIPIPMVSGRTEHARGQWEQAAPPPRCPRQNSLRPRAETSSSSPGNVTLNDDSLTGYAYGGAAATVAMGATVAPAGAAVKGAPAWTVWGGQAPGQSGQNGQRGFLGGDATSGSKGGHRRRRRCRRKRVRRGHLQRWDSGDQRRFGEWGRLCGQRRQRR